MLGSSRGMRRKPRGIAIRPEAVRQARMEMGMSLSELAGGEVTRAAIHQVETGKMRPSMRTLELIARRTGRPVSFFMVGQEGSEEQQARRDELTRLVDTGAYREAISLGGSILEGALQPGIEADVQFSVGRALVRTGDGTRALPHLARARQLFERLGDAWMLAHVADQEATALFLVEDPRTLSVALDALERSDQLDSPAPGLRASILNILGNVHLRSHDWRNAARFFEMGLSACEELVSLRLAARLNDGLSLARQRLGDFSGALRSAERAFALYSVDTDVVGLIRAENNLGYVLLRQGELDAAATHLDRALALCDEHDVQRIGRAHVLNSIGELHLARREPGLACTHLLRALEVATTLGERDSEAMARHLLGSAYVQLDDEETAHAYYASAIDLLEQLDLPERLRVCAVEYAELLYARGRFVESIAYWRIAAGARASSIMDSPIEMDLSSEVGA